MELWIYVAAVNFLVAIGYYNLILLIVLAPIKIKWLRAAGRLGVILAVMLSGFFLGCGTHHLEMCLHLIENPELFLRDDLLHMAFWDSLQAVCAIGGGVVLVKYGDRLVEKLRTGTVHGEGWERK